MHRTPLPALLLGALLVPTLLPDARAQAPLTPPQIRIPSAVDSGFLNNPSDTAVVAFRERVRFDDSAWLQLTFGESVSLPAGSFLRMTSTLDGAVQRHDGRTLVDWSGWSAAFNGSEVILELVAGPRTVGNRVVVDEVTRGLPIMGPESICGNVDDRQLSSDPRQGRLFIGCTGWMIGGDVMLTAGHCVGSGTRVVEFNVPLSSPGGSVVRAHPDDQYPFTVLQSLNGGVGSDWAVNRVGPNSNHGQLPTQRNGGQWYNLGAVPGGPGGQNIRITGYGSTSSPVSPTWYLAQKTHLGSLSQVNATSLCYATDTTGGNSGSPVIHENTGNAIGIHTHGGCTSTGGCNSGTRIDRSDLQAAVLAATRTPGAFRTYGQGCLGTGRTPAACVTLNANGGTLSNSRALNEYAYAATTSTALQVTGFRVFSASTTGSAETVTAAIYSDAGGVPAATPLAQTTITIGPAAAFHQADFAAAVTVPAGAFYVAVDHSAQTTYVVNLTSGSRGAGYWRRPALSGTWAVSNLVQQPSFQVLCAGGGTSGAVPSIAGAGDPYIGRSYTAALSAARANATAVVFTGFSDTSWTGGSLPFSLAAFGAPACDLLADPAVSDARTTDGNGAASYGIGVPNDPTLVGFALFHQWFVFDAGANQLGIATSNALEVQIGG